MSLRRCIPDMVARGELTPEQGRQMDAVFGERLAVYRRSMSTAAAEAAASDAAIAAMEQAAIQKRRQALLQVKSQQTALAAIGSFDGGKGLEGGVINPKAAQALFDFDERAPYANVEGRRRAIRGRAHAMLDGILARHRRNVAGAVRHKAELVDLTRERFGEATGNVNAREFSEAFGEASEMLRQRFNAAGGNIGKLETWGLPQSHDARAVRAAGWQEWRAFFGERWERLNRSRMIDDTTGAPFTDAGLERAMRAVFETVRTDGWSKINPGGGFGAKLANQRAEHRFMHFASADDWMAYAERFGQGTPFDAMMSHVDAMSRDIALLEILGPNPDATVKWLKDGMMKSAQMLGDDKGRAADAANAGAMRVQRLYDELTGELRRPESRRLALTFSALRSFQTSAKLGSATLSAVTDLGFGTVARKMNGMPAARMVWDCAKLLRPGAEEDRKLAVRLGLVAEEWANHAASQNRYLNEELAGEVSRRMAEATLRISGLSHWTQSGRWAFGMETLGYMTGETAKGWDALNPAFRGMLERYGLDGAAWDVIRAEPLEMERGVPWLNPTKFSDAALGDRVLEMIARETDFAVPTADLRTRAMFDSLAPRGTWIGELARSALLFKSFGVSTVLMQARRMMARPSVPGRVGYAVGTFLALTAMGGLALNLKEIAKGKDPRAAYDPEDPAAMAKFWGAATLQGGGFGIFGDFLSASTNRFGGGFGETLAGPLVADASNYAEALGGNAVRAIDGKDTKLGADLLRAGKSDIPVIGSLWYTRLALERLTLDQIQAEIDPDYRASWRRMEKRARDNGQGYFWEPGQLAPERAPDFANIIAEEGVQP